jgi:ABC-type glycerol-3-phosphate transport system substrate-binding protein
MRNEIERPVDISRRSVIKGAAALSGASAIGAAFPKPAIAQSKPISVLTLSQGIFGQPFVDLSPEFAKQTGIKVNLITMGYNEAIQKQTAAFAARSDAYDVVQVDSILYQRLRQIRAHSVARQPDTERRIVGIFCRHPCDVQRYVF